MSLVLTTLEFDVLWESLRLPRVHPALRVPSAGRTHTERRQLAGRAWEMLADRGLARGQRAVGEIVDMATLLANPQVAIDVWVWTDRDIRGLAVTNGSQALLAVVDSGEVWLIPARPNALAESAVSVAGEQPAGVGHSVSLPHSTLRAADADAKGDPKSLVTALEDRGVELWEAQELAGMLVGMTTRGQFGAEREGRRAGRVVAFYDTDAGRYLLQVGGQDWATVAPADNQLLVSRVAELLDEV
ncbi:ESX secretion-associated protein EspG [Amycolatopsis thermoflava]|uniref:ESX secretion-associated protein EspG n=1 Tax=Amycolatopsis thermoflava TaxID=84480 RepID=UPI00366195BB